MPIDDLYARKKKATTHLEISSAIEDQAIPFEGPSAIGGILILPTPCYGLDIPRERGFFVLLSQESFC